MRRYRKQRKSRQKYQKRTQRGGFLNWYGFAYTGRDTDNQVGKIAPGLIKNTSSEINNIAQQRINQMISQGEKNLPKILRGATENLFRYWRILENNNFKN